MDTKKLRQKILDLAIHGKLVPQDPNDEPASVLLERIREEKDRLIKEGKIKKTKSTASSDTSHYENVPFEVPEGWEWVSLSEITHSCLGKMLDKAKNQGTLQPYLRNVNVRWGTFELEDLLQMPFVEEEDERFSVVQGDLVVCEGGEPGRCAIWENKESIKFQKALHRIRCFNGALNYYIKIVIEWYASSKNIEKYYTGSTIKHLTGESLNTLQIPLPPIQEQHRIVSIVDQWMSLIDLFDTESSELKQSIEKAKSKILDLAIRGELVPQDATDEPALELLKRINPKAIASCDNPHYVGESQIPYNWCWTTLGAVGKWQSGGTPSRMHKEYYGGNIPWLKTGDLNDGLVTYIPEHITELGLENSSAKLNPIGSVLIAMYGATIGKVGILGIPATTNQACCACIEYKGITQQYLFLFLIANKTNFVAAGGGGAQPNISKEIITKTLIPLPPIEEQNRIAAKVQELFTQLDTIEKSLQA